MRGIRVFQYGLFLLFLAWMSPLSAQYFGKNKIQYQKHDWQYLQSRHFDVYYYKNNRGLAEFVADMAESCYVQLRKELRFRIQNRIPIVVYNSHNDFEQTNVSSELLEESVGGFTEIFKDRVVIPFQGSYEEFRHVIHHELTHAVMFQTFFGGRVGSILTGLTTSRLPMWLIEGLPEYQSLGWDTKSDMFIRDAVLNNYVPPIDMMNEGFMVYKGGQSLLYFLAEKYGEPKIGEILTKLQMTRDVDRVFRETLGLKTEELSKRWHKYLRQLYWPEIQGRNEPQDIAKKLTDHKKWKNFLNTSPALSPQGDKLVYLSDRSGFIDIYLMNVLEGKELGRLVKGERSDLFEEMHWTRPGMSWSPDGGKIAFAAKRRGKDALYILDVETKIITGSFTFDLDGLFAPDWSPDGKHIAFMGFLNGQSDIYELDLETQKLRQLTNDIFSDLDPVYSPSGDKVAFISDRSQFLGPPPPDFRMQNHAFRTVDLYTVSTDSGIIRRWTYTPAQEKSPVFSPDGEKIAFISDKNGIDNVYLLDLKTGSYYPITNLVSGVSHLSWSKNGLRLAFSAFENGGYDIYLMSNPLQIQPGSVEAPKTAFIEKNGLPFTILGKRQGFAVLGDSVESRVTIDTEYQNFIFAERFRREQFAAERAKKVFLDSTEYKTPEGKYKTYKYKIRFSPDYVVANAGYSQFWGFQGTSLITFSDVLGNHQIDLYTDLFYNLKNSNFQIGYYYLPRRIDVGGSLFHFSYRYYTYFEDALGRYFGYIRDRNYGGSLYMSRPFDRYRRLDWSLTVLAIDRDLVGIDPFYYFYYSTLVPYEMGAISKKRVAIFSGAYTKDNAIYGLTGPMSEERSNVSLYYSPLVSQKYGLEFWTLRADFRRYFMMRRTYSFAFRIAGGMSGGKHPQRFLLGGMSDWINYKIRDFSHLYFTENYFYFSTIETPLRGYAYYEMLGTRFALANFEFRFPMIQYLILGVPPIGFQDIRGALFLDIGSAWTNDRAWKPFASRPYGIPKLDDLKAGFGFGLRMNLGYFILRYDFAKPTDFENTGKAVHYFSLGAEF